MGRGARRRGSEGDRRAARADGALDWSWRPAPRRRHRRSLRVAVIGDSVLLGAKEELLAEFAGQQVTVDAVEDRSLLGAIGLFRSAGPALGDVVVLDLGYNDSSDPAVFRGRDRRRDDRARGRAARDLAQPTRLGPGPGRHERRTGGRGVPLRQPRRGRLERRGRRPSRLRVRRRDPPHGHRSTGDGRRRPRPLRPLRRVVDAHHDGSTDHRARDIDRTCAARRVGSAPVSRMRPIRVASTTAGSRWSRSPCSCSSVGCCRCSAGRVGDGVGISVGRRAGRAAPSGSVTGSRQAKCSHT